MGSSSESSWGSGVVGGGVGATLWRPLSPRSALVSVSECEHYVVVKGSKEKNLLFLQDMLASVSVSVWIER